MRVVGYVQDPRVPRALCEQPLRVVCRTCDAVELWPCNCSAATRCVPCAEKKRRLLARIVDHGITDRVGAGFTYLLTLTCPGSNDHRRWRQGSQHAGPRPECHCHDNGLSMGAWNAQESASWNRMRLALDRLVDGSLSYIGAVETQGRGALHRHVVIHVDRALLPDEVQDLALAAGYGCVIDLALAKSAQSVARYISKYVTKASGERPDVPWEREVINYVTGEITTQRTATYRTWSSAQTWGYTMAGLRDLMRTQADARARDLATLAARSPASPVIAASTADGTSIDSPDPPGS